MATNAATENTPATGIDLARHFPLVQKVARRLARRLPAFVELDELVAAGNLGLLEAAERFDAGRGYEFEAFAEFRIRGAMLDELRRADMLSRHGRRAVRKLSEATCAAEGRLGRSADSQEVAEVLGVSVDRLFAMQRDFAGGAVVGVSDAVLDGLADPMADDPSELTSRREQVAALTQAVSALPDKQRLVLALYYFEEQTLAQIGTILEVTESRVCQLHREALRRLKETLGTELD